MQEEPPLPSHASSVLSGQEPPLQSRASTAETAMTIKSHVPEIDEDDEPFEIAKMTFEPHDPRYGQSISSAKHGPYYMHMGDRVCSICIRNITTFMRKLCGRYQCMPCQVPKINQRCDCSTRCMTRFDESQNKI